MLELIARVPYQAWEQAGYSAITHHCAQVGFARRVFDRVRECRSQQDNEQWHLLIIEELLLEEPSPADYGWLRSWLIPQITAFIYYQLSFGLYVVRPDWSYRLNADFEDHAEHEYMELVAEHPEWETVPWESTLAADYGTFASPRRSAPPDRIRRARAQAGERAGDAGGTGPMSIQEQARALGDPTRHAIFRQVVESPTPVSVGDLTERLGLNHNAVRQHLAKLVGAGLVLEARAAPTGPGRPRLVYSVDPAAESRWDVTGPYERLSSMLTEIIRTGETPVEIGRRVGRDEAADHGNDPSGALERAMAQSGFEPTVDRQGDDIELLLHSCPFANAALADPDIICELHRGIAIGVAEAVGGIDIDELVRADPRRAPCRLRAHLDPERDAN